MMRILIALTLLLSPAFVTACESFGNLPAAQVRSDSAVLADTEASKIDRILAFENLRCAANTSLRDYAFREGWASGIPTIQGRALFDRLASKRQISVKLLAEDGLTRDHYEFQALTPTIVLKGAGAVAGENCISLSRAGDCNTSYAITIVGTNATFVENNIGTGTFGLSSDGKFIGTVTLNDPALTFRAEIALD